MLLCCFAHWQYDWGIRFILQFLNKRKSVWCFVEYLSHRENFYVYAHAYVHVSKLRNLPYMSQLNKTWIAIYFKHVWNARCIFHLMNKLSSNWSGNWTNRCLFAEECKVCQPVHSAWAKKRRVRSVYWSGCRIFCGSRRECDWGRTLFFVYQKVSEPENIIEFPLATGQDQTIARYLWLWLYGFSCPREVETHHIHLMWWAHVMAVRLFAPEAKGFGLQIEQPRPPGQCPSGYLWLLCSFCHVVWHLLPSFSDHKKMTASGKKYLHGGRGDSNLPHHTTFGQISQKLLDRFQPFLDTR